MNVCAMRHEKTAWSLNGRPSHDYPADEWNVVEKAFHPELRAQLETMLAFVNGYLGIRGARRRAAQTLKTALSLMGSMKRGRSSTEKKLTVSQGLVRRSVT